MVAQLPLTHDPLIKLPPNKNKAECQSTTGEIKQKLKGHGGCSQFREEATTSGTKFQFRAKLSKINFLSTPWRLVFDASQSTASGWRLNDTLVKGRNNMNMLVEVVICWIIYRNAFHTYIQNMYNSA